MGVGITGGVKGWRTADLTQHHKTEKGTGKRTVDAFKDPDLCRNMRQISMHLCDRLKSDCAHCEIMCGYGRRYLQLLQEKEGKACST